MAQGTASTRLRSGIPSEAASGAPAADGSRRWTTSLASFHLLWVAVALFAVGVLLRVSGITTQSLWNDDGFSLDYSSCDNLTACFKNITSGHSSEQFNILYFSFCIYGGMSSVRARYRYVPFPSLSVFWPCR